MKTLENFEHAFYDDPSFKHHHSIRFKTLSVGELKKMILDLRIALADIEPAYRRIQPNGKYYTVYNKLGKMIACKNEYPVTSATITDCPDVYIKRQFVFNEMHAKLLEKRMMCTLAKNLGFKTFKNGNLYRATKTNIEKYLAAYFTDKRY